MDIKSFKWKIKMLVSRYWEFRINTKEYFSNSKLKHENRKAYLERAILVGAHSLERSLGFRNSGAGHSVSECSFLLSRVEEWINKGYEQDNFCICEAIGVLEYYFSIQEHGEKFLALNNRFTELKKKTNADLRTVSAGVKEIEAPFVNENDALAFENMLENRHSVRQYSKDPITKEEVAKAISLANKAPSACNRQPVKVYVALGEEKKAEIHKGFTINKTFRDEFYGYLILTVRRNLFYGFEHYQWYINGGIYLGYLSLVLHSLNIGSCIMQWKAFDKTEKVLKESCGISPNEAIVAVIGIGKYDQKVKSLCAQRLREQDNTIFV